jgi:hypothetical protein
MPMSILCFFSVQTSSLSFLSSVFIFPFSLLFSCISFFILFYFSLACFCSVFYCSKFLLGIASTVILGSRSRGVHDHVSLSHSLNGEFALVIHKNLVHTSQETHYVSTTKRNRLMPFREATTRSILIGRGHTKDTGNSNFRELLSAWVEHMSLNGAAHIEETATQFPQYELLHSVTCVQCRLITILGNCGCVAVVSFQGVPSPVHSVSKTQSFIVVKQAVHIEPLGFMHLNIYAHILYTVGLRSFPFVDSNVPSKIKFRQYSRTYK